MRGWRIVCDNATEVGTEIVTWWSTGDGTLKEKTTWCAERERKSE